MKLNFLKSQYGLTLIELMISMALGAVVVFAVGSILVTSNQAASVSDTLSDTQDTGRFVADYMNRQLLRTGYDPETSGFDPFTKLCTLSGEVICISDLPDLTGDRLAVRRLAETGETNAVTCYGAALTDSAGTPISTNVIVTDVYWVEVVDGISNLRCQSFDEDGTVRDNPGDSFGNAQSLVAGVLAMHVLYGESDSEPLNNVLNISGYHNALQVTDWDLVFAVRIGVLTQSQVTTEAQAWEQNYTVMDSGTYTYDDQLARQVFSTSITLRN